MYYIYKAKANYCLCSPKEQAVLEQQRETTTFLSVAQKGAR